MKISEYVVVICNFQRGIANRSILVIKHCFMAWLISWPWEGAIQHKEFIIYNFITWDSITTATTITEYCRIAYASNMFIWTKFLTPYQNFILPLMYYCFKKMCMENYSNYALYKLFPLLYIIIIGINTNTNNMSLSKHLHVAINLANMSAFNFDTKAIHKISRSLLSLWNCSLCILKMNNIHNFVFLKVLKTVFMSRSLAVFIYMDMLPTVHCTWTILLFQEATHPLLLMLIPLVLINPVITFTNPCLVTHILFWVIPSSVAGRETPFIFC